MGKLLVFDKDRYIEIPLQRKQMYKEVEIRYRDELVYIENQTIAPFEMTKCKIGKVLLITDSKHIVKRLDRVFISNEKAHICIFGLLGKVIIDKEQMHMMDTIDIYVNGRLERKKTIPIIEDMILQIDTIRIEVHAECLVIYGKTEQYQTYLRQIVKRQEGREDFPIYRRSPRLIKKVDTKSIEIVNPPEAENMQAKSVLTTFVPTVMGMCVTIGVGIFIGRSIMLLLSMTSSILAFGTNVVKYYSERKEIRIRNKKREEMYTRYLLMIQKKLYRKRKHNEDVLSYNYPTIEIMQSMILNYNRRIYERTYQDEDFLMLVIGKYHSQSLFEIIYKKDILEMKRDVLKEQARDLQEEYSVMKDVPVCVDMKKGHIGLIGERQSIHKQLQAYLLELACNHSYHEVEIIYLYNHTYHNKFSYLSWYPHFRIRSMNVSTTIHNEHKRDQIVGSLYQLLKERKHNFESQHGNNRYFPHIIFVIDEPSLIGNHAIMEYLQLPVNALGYSIIYITDTQATLPENVKTVIVCEDDKQGCLLINEGEYCNQKFYLLETQGVDFAYCARVLAGLQHEEKVTSQIPKVVDFLSMYGVEKVEQLPIVSLWDTNLIYKTIAVPLGLRAKGDVVYLNLHEKAHGPHGLIAGTTGSGKSEIIQSYVLSLAIHFHPEDVGFLLIDYKGGGMANLFKQLPHVLGTITNLDGSESMRALVSIKSELSRRQKILEQASVNTINAYTKKYKSGEAKEPLPHLFIISDEFAELKKEQPEFMSELISTARIGRSLGVHLLLATQKPSGVVDDQIWSNAKFKLCLKVQNEADSNEVLKTPDAASITQAGRSYLQVGNNEIYELFQSAYSGGVYETKQQEEIDNRVFLITELGQGHVLNPDVEEIYVDSTLKTTQLGAIVEHIAKLYTATVSQNKVKKPWLPSLEAKIVLPNEKYQQQLICSIGIVDIPSKQQQVEYDIDITKEGNIGYFAASGYGKSNFLSTVIVSLARKNSADTLHFYILDFGNSALVIFDRLYHTADYITFDEEEKFDKFLVLIEKEMKRRKQVLAQHQTQNFLIHNQTNAEKLKAIVIVIDQFDVLKEKGLEVETVFSKIARDGVSLGIYILFSATRMADIRYATMHQIKVKIVGFLFDEHESLQIVGRTQWQVPDSKGRMLVKTDTIHLAQMYMPVNANGDIEYRDMIHNVISEINRKNGGKKAKRIVVLPEQVTHHTIFDYDWERVETYALGLDKESVKIRGFTFCSEPFLITGSPRSGKTNALKILYAQQKGHKYVFDTSKMSLHYVRQDTDTNYAFEEKSYVVSIEKMKALVESRKQQFYVAYENDQQLLPHEFYSTLPECTCFIDDIDYFHETLKMKIPQIDIVLTQAVECGIQFIVCGDSTKMNALNSSATVFKRTGTGLVVGSCMVVNPFNIGIKEAPTLGDALLFNAYGKQAIKMAKFDE